MPRTLAIFNPHAGTAPLGSELRRRLELRPGLTTASPPAGELADAVRAAVAAGCTRVIAAGGDGTVHAVVNALDGLFDRAALGILPLGTGNDLCRTLGIPTDPAEALVALDAGCERRIDLIRVTAGGRRLWCVNAASGGFSGRLQEALTPEMKAAWGPLAYLRGAAAVLPDLTGYQATLSYDGGPPEHAEALNVIVANGRFAARGWEVAPPADVSDGLLDVVVVRSGDLDDLAAVAAGLLVGDYLSGGQARHRRARSVRIESTPAMWFSVDGELVEPGAAEFAVEPGVLRVVAPG
jgi:diacylglycerol kinase (ATP)